MRITPEAVLGRVFGALDACLIATMALGAAVMPALVHWLGLWAALAVVGLGVAALALVGLPRMRNLDTRLRRPAFLDRLEAVPMFAPLTPGVLESLARSLITVPVAAGEIVLREGEDSDRRRRGREPSPDARVGSEASEATTVLCELGAMTRFGDALRTARR